MVLETGAVLVHLDMGLLIFILVLFIRWVSHTLLTSRSTWTGPQDLLSAVLFVLYVLLLICGLLGNIIPVAIATLCIATVIRVITLSSLRSGFAFDVAPRTELIITRCGINSLTRNPLIISYWIELTAFAMCSLLFKGLVILVCGLFCGWHAHEDNNRLYASSVAYREYFRTTSNWPLSVCFPERARIFDINIIRLDTFAVYAFAGFFLGSVVIVGYGVSIVFLILTLPTSFAGAFLYWNLTSKRRK